MLKRLVSRVRTRLTPRRHRPAILMYHRVLSLAKDPWDLAVAPERFAEQMAWLRSHRTPLSMTELVERLQEGTLPANAVAVTFDDGYRDNLVLAKPVLERYSVPATVFVASGYTGCQSPFWWDELAGMMLECRQPMSVNAQVNGQAVTLEWGELEPADADTGWRGWDPPKTARQRAYIDVWSRLKSAPEVVREQVVNALRRSLAAPSDPLGLPMHCEELQELVSGDLVSLGGHTVHHPALPDLDIEACRGEVEEGGSRCRTFTPGVVSGFAYPFGDLSPEVRDVLATSSFAWACTTAGLFLDARAPDRYALPRIGIPNVSMHRFKMLLSSID